jgi:hypothetical protein
MRQPVAGSVQASWRDHLARVIAPVHLREEGALITVGEAGTQHVDED